LLILCAIIDTLSSERCDDLGAFVAALDNLVAEFERERGNSEPDCGGGGNIG
jgi:hypothetical protein